MHTGHTLRTLKGKPGTSHGSFSSSKSFILWWNQDKDLHFPQSFTLQFFILLHQTLTDYSHFSISLYYRSSSANHHATSVSAPRHHRTSSPPKVCEPKRKRMATREQNQAHNHLWPHQPLLEPRWCRRGSSLFSPLLLSAHFLEFIV